LKDYVYHRTPLSSTVTELYQKIVDSLKDYLKQQHEDGSVYLQLLERLNDARRIAHNLRKRLLLYRHTTGLTNSMNTLLDLVYVKFFNISFLFLFVF
jgi:signal transduction histidine kinase